MLTIRESVFETNSSSVHALIISENEPAFTGKRTLRVSVGEYGWGPDVLDTPEERANYFYTAMCCQNYYRDNDPFNRLGELLAPYGVTLVRGVEPVFRKYDNGRYYLDNGYIDHAEDTEALVQLMCDNPNLLYRFIFSEASCVVVTNDNYDKCDEHIKSHRPSSPHIYMEKGN